jgi:hypothetical protein
LTHAGHGAPRGTGGRKRPCAFDSAVAGDSLAVAFAALFALIAASGTAHAATPTDPSQICEEAAQQASRDSGVPLDVLRAISLTETGRRHAGGFRPWPWTVNMQGTGLWFDTPDEALAYVDRKFSGGARSFDVGCFQINYKWHGQAFSSISQMFEPAANARYAANLLRSLHGELGSWSAAAGAYHSRTPEFANRYRDRFDRIRARLTGQPLDETADTLTAANTNLDGLVTPAGDGTIPEIPDIVLAMNGGLAPPPPPPRVNRYPLLQQGGPYVAVLGSLVPPAQGPVVALFGPDPGADAAVPVIAVADAGTKPPTPIADAPDTDRASAALDPPILD